MRQYVWVTPWCLILTCAYTNNIYFQALGMISASNFWTSSMICLYNNPLTCVNKSASCYGALPFDNHLEMHLQNGSVLCIWSRASCLSAVRSFGAICWVVSTVVKSGATGLMVDWVLEGAVSAVVWHWCEVLFLMLNASPPKFVAVSSLMVVLSLVHNLTSLERQLAALFHAPDIHSNVILLVTISSPHLLTLLLAFFPFRNLASDLWSLQMMISAPWR